jgi:hypothetical protein
MIPETIFAAKGDLLGASANDTPAILSVGANGETLVADSSAATGLSWQGNYAAGKNKIINGDFGINQRNFTSISSISYGFDRWLYAPSGATATYTSQTFTLGTAPVAGYEGKNFARLTVTTGNDFARLTQLIESVRTFAGQTATLSFWAKGTNPTTAGNLKAYLTQYFGTGGSPSANVDVTEQTFVLTANWTRYSFTFSVPSISGKTIGTDNNDYLAVNLGQGTSASSDAWTLDLWGVQLEAGSVATGFQTATGTIQGELAACQRYYQKSYAAATVPGSSFPGGYSVTIVENNIPDNNYFHYQPLIVQTRAEPTITIYSGSGATNKVSTAAGADLAANSAVAALITDSHFIIQNLSGGALTASAGGFLFFYVASAEL